MENREIIIVPVEHSLRFLEEQLPNIKNNIRANSKIGIELDQEMLIELKKILKSALMKKRKTYIYARKLFNEILSSMKEDDRKKYLKETHKYEREYDIGTIYEGLWFFSKIIKIAQERNCTIIPLDSRYAGIKRAILVRTTQKPQRTNLQKMLIDPVIEAFFIKRILKEKPETIIIGAGHANPIARKLGKKGFKATIKIPEKKTELLKILLQSSEKERPGLFKRLLQSFEEERLFKRLLQSSEKERQTRQLYWQRKARVKKRLEKLRRLERQKLLSRIEQRARQLKLKRI